MKVYVVTDGSYSDYTIEKIFSNRPAAEEFKKWRRIQNDIEEWEVYDEPFGTQDGEKVMFIRVQGTVYPEAVVDIRYDIRPELLRDWELSKGAGIHSVSKPGVFNIHCYRHVPVDKWDEEKYKDLLTKVLYDYAGIVKAMLAEGASIRDVEMALYQREKETAI